MLSFFEPTESDPKPCKSTAPDTKSDSGIDLTADKATENSASNTQLSNNSKYSTTCLSGAGDTYLSDADDDYDGDTSGTETDNDPFDEDYFLDVGLNELMLQSTEHLELSNTDSSTWCSNMNKFSNILNTLPTDDSATRQYKAMTSVCLSDDENYEDITKSILDINELRENSDTESQMVGSDHMCEGLESDDEFTYKPVASQTDMTHYYLSATSDTGTAEWSAAAPPAALICSIASTHITPVGIGVAWVSI